MSSLRLDNIYTDGMVVPANKPFKISGQAIRNTQVTLEVLDKTYSVKANEKGDWVIEIAPIPIQVTTNIKISSLDEFIVLKKVRTGTVILLTGQSNIEFKFRDDSEYQEQIAHLNLKNVYFYNVPQLEYQDDKITLPKDLETSKWQIANAETLWEMSDIGFWMIKKLHELNPDEVIGIVDCYKGGTSISSWVPESVLNSDNKLIDTFVKPFKIATTNKSKADYEQEFSDYNAAVEKHNTDLAKFQSENPKVSLSDAKDRVGHTPWPPPMTPTSYLRPNGLFHTMIEQVKNYVVDKVVWYQGENDAPNPDVYGTMLKGLIISWRKLFCDKSLPFYVVQLPGYFDEPKDSWAIIRQYQLEVTQNINDVHLISIADTGEKHNIHPTHKRIAGTRIGEIISGNGYDSTPYVYRQQIVGDKLILFVKAAGILSQKGKTEFLVQRNGTWVKQEVNAVGKIIAIDNAENITKIRYAYENYPTCTLFNEFLAPVAPFEMEIR